MELIKAVGEALKHIIEWVKITYLGLEELLGISEWSIIWVAIGVIAAITVPKILKKSR